MSEDIAPPIVRPLDARVENAVNEATRLYVSYLADTTKEALNDVNRYRETGQEPDEESQVFAQDFDMDDLQEWLLERCAPAPSPQNSFYHYVNSVVAKTLVSMESFILELDAQAEAFVSGAPYMVSKTSLVVNQPMVMDAVKARQLDDQEIGFLILKGFFVPDEEGGEKTDLRDIVMAFRMWNGFVFSRPVLTDVSKIEEKLRNLDSKTAYVKMPNAQSSGMRH
jgi:hypothetical protein